MAVKKSILFRRGCEKTKKIMQKKTLILLQ